ncbi:MAG: hypothetical protein IPJ65_26990 [Archangiaceae bacterium]|nr:hypothetical protein [Archangiaceae bacterium]
MPPSQWEEGGAQADRLPLESTAQVPPSWSNVTQYAPELWVRCHSTPS